MRVSVWRQFSSNHSGSFSVVGRFTTEDAAREAADKLRDIIHRLDLWYENPDNQAWFEQVSMNGLRPLSPVEAEIRDEYGIEWEPDGQGVDWYGDGHEPIIQLGHDVFFSVGETWCMPQPISAILAKLGGQPYEEHEFGGPITSISIKLTCTFDTEDIAKQASTLIRKWKEEFNGENPPWVADEIFSYTEITEISDNSSTIYLNVVSGLNWLPLLIEWLRNQGGKTITYTFETHQHFG